MKIDDSYIVPEGVIEYLCQGERSFLALRLIHGLLYAFDHALRGKMALVPSQYPGVHSIRTSLIADAVGPDKSNDNRWIHEACAELVGQGLLQVAKVEGRVFRFKLARRFSESFQQTTRAFAIMHTRHVRQCRTLHDLFFLKLACLHGGKDRPKFLLPRLPKHLEKMESRLSLFPPQEPKQDPWRTPWSKSRLSWERAAIRVGEMLDHGYLIAPRQDMIDDFISEAAVKIQHPKTKWERGKLYKFDPGTRGVLELPRGNKRKILNSEALRNKWHQTIIQ